MDKLIEAIRVKLNIADNIYINMEIEGYIKDINPSDYMEFFSELSGDKFAYKQGMDRVAIVSASFNERKRAKLNRNVSSKANELANKLLTVKQQVEDKYEHLKFDAIKLDGELLFKNNELMVLSKIDMNDLMSVIDKQSFDLTVSKINTVMEQINLASVEGMALSINDKKLLK